MSDRFAKYFFIALFTYLAVLFAIIVYDIYTDYRDDEILKQELIEVGKQFNCEYLQHDAKVAYYDCHGIVVLDRVN